MSSLLAATSRRTALMAVHRVPTATVAAGAPTTVLASRVVSGGAVWAARGLSTKPPSTSGVLQMLHQYVYKVGLFSDLDIIAVHIWAIIDQF